MCKETHEYHVYERMNGHVSSTDCWCEPVKIRSTKLNDTLILVVEHNESFPARYHRKDIERLRSKIKDPVTVLLDSI